MAEQAINTIYGLGDQPDALCSDILRTMTVRVFDALKPTASRSESAAPEDDVEMQDSREGTPVNTPPFEGDTGETPRAPNTNSTPKPTGDAFELSQLLFVAGHSAIKQLVHLELIERDVKRRKAEENKKAGAKSAAQDELEQVAGSTEDDIGDSIAYSKETELLYGENSLLAVYGPMAATIVAQPKVYRVSIYSCMRQLDIANILAIFSESNAQNGSNSSSE